RAQIRRAGPRDAERRVLYARASGRRVHSRAAFRRRRRRSADGWDALSAARRAALRAVPQPRSGHRAPTRPGATADAVRRALGSGRLVHGAEPERRHDDEVSLPGRRELDRAKGESRAVKTAPLTFLLERQNPDGGWPSQPGRSSNTEATAFAVLALRGLAAGDATRAGERGLRWLSERESPACSGFRIGSARTEAGRSARRRPRPRGPRE